MKGIVAEIDKKHMIIITEKGDFVKHKKLADYEIGDEINVNTKSINMLVRQLSTAAACLIISVMLATGVFAYYTPYSYISVDINPSIGLSLNRFERVIDIKALNEDAELLLKASAGLKNKQLDKAMEQLLESAYDTGYLKQDTENSVMLVVSTANDKEESKLSTELNKVTTEALSKLGSEYNVIMEKAPVKEYKESIASNISPGKVILTEKIKESKPEVKLDEVKNMSVQQAMGIIKSESEKNKENKEKDKNDEKSSNANKDEKDKEDKKSDDSSDKNVKENKDDNGNKTDKNSSNEKKDNKNNQNNTNNNPDNKDKKSENNGKSNNSENKEVDDKDKKSSDDKGIGGVSSGSEDASKDNKEESKEDKEKNNKVVEEEKNNKENKNSKSESEDEEDKKTDKNEEKLDEKNQENKSDNGKDKDNSKNNEDKNNKSDDSAKDNKNNKEDKKEDKSNSDSKKK